MAADNAARGRFSPITLAGALLKRGEQPKHRAGTWQHAALLEPTAMRDLRQEADLRVEMAP